MEYKNAGCIPYRSTSISTPSRSLFKFQINFCSHPFFVTADEIVTATIDDTVTFSERESRISQFNNKMICLIDRQCASLKQANPTVTFTQPKYTMDHRQCLS